MAQTAIVVEKVASVSLACAALAFMPLLLVLKIAVILGHAHILTAWLYWYLAGKTRGTFPLRFSAALLLVFGSYLLHPWFSVLILVAPLFFLFHFVFDEIHLLRVPLNLRSSPVTPGRFLEALMFVALYAGLILDAVPGHLLRSGCSLTVPPEVSHGPKFLPLLIGSGLIYGLLILLGRHRPDWGSAYFLGGSAALGWLIWRNFQCDYVALLAFLILVHVLNWYIHYFLNLAGSPRAQALYLARVLGLILLSALAFSLGQFNLAGPASPGLRFLYQETFYDLWTMLHLIFSLRLVDLLAIFRLPARMPA
ncbi:hypothetical protein JST97_26605 [bacterium]|nr:hypothetical protein [bacterium]